MSQFGPGPRKFADGDFVLTPKGQGGKIVEAYTEAEPDHDEAYWIDDRYGWETSGDQHLEWIYKVEVSAEVHPWPEDMLKSATVLDMLV